MGLEFWKFGPLGILGYTVLDSPNKIVASRRVLCYKLLLYNTKNVLREGYIEEELKFSILVFLFCVFIVAQL